MRPPPVPLIAIFLLVLLAATGGSAGDAAAFSVEPESWLFGDANCDDEVGSTDGLLLLQVEASLINASDQPCVGHADVNSDYLLDARDALLVLQYEAGLYLGLAVQETRLCKPLFDRQGLQKLFDLDGDGRFERVIASADTVLGTATVSVSELNEAGSEYSTVIELVFAAPAHDRLGGPYPAMAGVDLTGDGAKEAVLCASYWRQAGAQPTAADLATSATVIRYAPGSGEAALVEEDVIWMEMSQIGEDLVVKSLYPSLNSDDDCIDAIVRTYTWGGAAFVLVEEKVNEYSYGPGC